MLPGRALIDGPALAHLGFKVRQLLKGATAHRPINKFDLIVLHFGVQQFEQPGSTYRVDQYYAASNWTTLNSHAIAKATDLETNHTLGAKRVDQGLGIGHIIAQISDNESVVVVTAINRCQCACARAAIKTLRQFFQLLYAEQPRPGRTVAADDGGRTIATAPDVMRDNEGPEAGPGIWILSME